MSRQGCSVDDAQCCREADRPAVLNRAFSGSAPRHNNDAVEAFGEGGAEGVDDGARRAGAGDVRVP